MNKNTNNQAAFIWSLADLLRSDFKQSQYGRVIFTVYLVTPERILEDKKEAVLAELTDCKRLLPCQPICSTTQAFRPIF
jgi:type I restriction enzyme M protein